MADMSPIPSTGPSELASQLARLACQALQFEDVLLRDEARRNPQVYPGSQPGILRFNNERYYQFVIARRFLGTMPWKTILEIDTHDLILQDPANKKRHAIVEMKRWMSASGEKEIPGILCDLFRKLPTAEALHKVMMIFSVNETLDQARGNLEWLAKRVGENSDSPWHFESFQTIDERHRDAYFWIATHELNDQIAC